uniref:Amino acid transporter n=1 Tax=Arion vulgaris TaxID=1028688 RepID=A0A0B7B0J1_9EUPU
MAQNQAHEQKMTLKEVHQNGDLSKPDLENGYLIIPYPQNNDLAKPNSQNGDPIIPDSQNGDLAKPDSQKGDAPATTKSKVVDFFKQNGLVLATLVGIVVGAGLGFGLRYANMNDHAMMWLGVPGELYLRSLKATIVPLVICMVITSAASLDAKTNGKVALVAMTSFFLTHIAAVVIAIILSQVFRPDVISGDGDDKGPQTAIQTQDVFADLLRNIFPDNIVGATITQTMTQYSTAQEGVSVNRTNNATIVGTVTTRSVGTTGGLITICTALGIAAGKILSQDSEFLRFFKQSQDVVFVVIRWLFWTTPVGVTSLIAESVAGVDDIRNVFYNLGMLLATVIVGLTIHMFIVLPLILFVLIRKNPFTFLFRCVRPFFIAFAATATSVALPDMMTSCSRCGISKKISSFVIPMSVTLQADGSALYMAAGALFIARAAGQAMSFETMCVVGALTSVLAHAIPPVPSSSIVTLIIILTSVNVSIKGVALLFAVEWILDRYRSGVNAVSHIMVAAFTDAICSKVGMAVKESNDYISETENITIKTEVAKKNVTNEKKTSLT